MRTKPVILPRWLGAKDAATYLGYKHDWIDERALEWQDTPVAGKIRYKYDRSPSKHRRFLVADLEPMNIKP